MAVAVSKSRELVPLFHQHFRPQQISFTDPCLSALPKSTKTTVIAMFCWHGHLRAALPTYGQRSTAKICAAHVDSTTCNMGELAHLLHY